MLNAWCRFNLDHVRRGAAAQKMHAQNCAYILCYIGDGVWQPYSLEIACALDAMLEMGWGGLTPGLATALQAYFFVT